MPAVRYSLSILRLIFNTRDSSLSGMNRSPLKVRFVFLLNLSSIFFVFSKRWRISFIQGSCYPIR